MSFSRTYSSDGWRIECNLSSESREVALTGYKRVDDNWSWRITTSIVITHEDKCILVVQTSDRTREPIPVSLEQSLNAALRWHQRAIHWHEEFLTSEPVAKLLKDIGTRVLGQRPNSS